MICTGKNSTGDKAKFQGSNTAFIIIIIIIIRYVTLGKLFNTFDPRLLHL